MLAAQAPDLRQALERARDEGLSHVILDGKIIPADRCREKTVSVRGEVIDVWYSGKAHVHGGNIQAVIAPDGFPLWVSEAEPGSVHDITAARIHALPGLYRAAATGLPTPRRPRLRRRGHRRSYPGQAGRRRAGPRYRHPHPQRRAPVPALPRRTRIRPADRPLAYPPAHHRQPQQDRRHRPRHAHPYPFRARLYQLKNR